MKFGLPKLFFKKNIRTLLIVVLIMHLADYIIVPILPIILSIDKGLKPQQIGIIIGTGSLTFQIGSVIGGVISDRIGRKITMVIGTLIEIGTLIGFGLSNSFMMFLIFEIFGGAGGGITAPTIKAAIAEYSSESTDTRTTAFSLRGMAANLGVALGGLIPLLVIGFRFATYFMMSAFFYFIILLISIIFIKNTCIEKKCGNTSLKRYLGIFNNRPFVIFSLISIFVWAIYSQLTILLPLRASEIFENGKIVGSIWTITSLILVVFQTFMTRHIIRKHHLLTSISIALVLMGIGIFLIGYSNTYLLLLLSATVFIFGIMLSTPTIDSMTSELADQEIIGAYFSIANIIYGLGFALGSYSGGQLINIYGINSNIPWLILSITSISLAFIVLLTRQIKSLKNITFKK